MRFDVQEPIFVVGTGRSGSTIFFDILARHPQVAWLSRLADDHPNRHWLHCLMMQARSNRILDFAIGRRFGPSEAYPFWDLVCPGFSNPYRDLLEDDVTLVSANRARDSIRKLVTGTRNRFLAKITGWPRVRYLRKIFPTARFIEVARDPYATVASLLEVPFWDGWRGPPNWRRGPLPPDLDAIWRQEGESFASLAAIEYVIVQRAMLECRASLPPEHMHTVSYSMLCAENVPVFRDAANFCQLDWSSRFEREVRRFKLVNRDEKWRDKLTEVQQNAIQRTLVQARVMPPA
jgi:hypothetical protein